jgi:hypothetical protein
MLGIGAAIMLYVQFRGQVGLLQHAAGEPIKPATDQFRGPRPGNVDAAVIASSRHRIARHRNQPIVAPVTSAERRVGGAAADHLGLRPNPFAS